MLDRWLHYSVRRRLLDRHLDGQRDRMCGRVLEVGNGAIGRRGRFRPPAAEAAQWVYVDLRAVVGPHVRGDIQRLPFQEGVFDTAVCLEMLEYVAKPQTALREIRRVLMPGGTLVLAAPFLHRTDAANDLWRFTEPGLRRILDEAGFDVEAVRAQGGALAVAANILRYGISIIPSPVVRIPVSLLLALPLLALVTLDETASRCLPALRTFSTGFLVTCRGRLAHTASAQSQASEGIAEQSMRRHRDEDGGDDRVSLSGVSSQGKAPHGRA